MTNILARGLVGIKSAAHSTETMLRTAIQIARNVCDLFGWNFGNGLDAVQASRSQWKQEGGPTLLNIEAKKPASPSQDAKDRDDSSAIDAKWNIVSRLGGRKFCPKFVERTHSS